MAALYIPPIVIASLTVGWGIGFLLMRAMGPERVR